MKKIAFNCSTYCKSFSNPLASLLIIHCYDYSSKTKAQFLVVFGNGRDMSK